MDQNDPAKNKKSEVIINLYQKRFKQLHIGQECYKKGDFAKTIEHYSNYLSILAQFFDTEESKLKPEFFNQKKDLGELLLLSNVYWNLAKIYDKNPKFQHQSVRCLEQFLKFTKGYKHQHSNARMLRNYINSNRPKNKKNFKQIYEKMEMGSRSCFIATYCFGYDATVTRQLRMLKEDISGNFLGDVGIEFYYKHAPGFISFFERHEKIKRFALPPIKNFLSLIAWFHHILKSRNDDYP